MSKHEFKTVSDLLDALSPYISARALARICDMSESQMLQYKLFIPGILPHYIPEGYEMVTTVADDRDDVTVLFCQLQRGDDTIVLQYRVWKGNESLAETQKDENDPEQYKNPNGQLFYIAQNEKLLNATWAKGTIECSIFNVSSREELIRILDSIQGD